MNAVEIEAAVSDLAVEPFNAGEFAYAFLAAFGNKDTTLKKLRTGNSNASDFPGGVLQRNNIHIAVCDEGNVSETLTALLASPATTKAKAKFVLATDGKDFEAKDLVSDELVACAYQDFPNHFGLFLPLAGISTVREIKDNPIDVRATGRLNKLYVELLRENPAWAKEDRRSDMNHFMARLIFCFFAEDTGIFNRSSVFTQTVEQMSDRDGSNTHEVLEVIFRAMNIKFNDRTHALPRLPNWAAVFPYVNGGLFSGSTEVPRFTRIARTYLNHAANLNWKEINPDIFGSMIQAVADDEERGALGMHYTSVPNILKVLNPLFLDELRAQLEAAGDNKAKLLNLRKRMARIRVFDPACGSGNFLVIAYKQMREIEAEINRRRGEEHLRSDIPLTNFRGIELRDFPAEIARLALIIAEFQCDVLYRGQQDAVAEFLPLNTENWIVSGNALRLDWLNICPPTGTGVKVISDDLFNTPLDQSEIDFENEGGETYICGNPPYLGSTWQSEQQKDDLRAIFAHRCKTWKSLDYVAGWFMKAADYGTHTPSTTAFVSTNSICQGQQVAMLWPLLFAAKAEIFFAHTSFKWANLASHNAGVTVVVVGITNQSRSKKKLFSVDQELETNVREVSYINAYLIAGANVIVEPASTPIDDRVGFISGNVPDDDGALLERTKEDFGKVPHEQAHLIKPFIGSFELINGVRRYCLWVEDADLALAKSNPEFLRRFQQVQKKRSSPKAGPRAKKAANVPHQFGFISNRQLPSIVIPRVSSENRPYLPVDLADKDVILGDRNFALYDAPLWNMAIIASRLHWVWIGTVCVRMRTDFSYSNTLGWNTFPIPTLTEQNKADLTACAEAILLAREAHFPATIADLYDPETMPENLRMAHERNDEVLERIYIGRRFKNDTERLEKLFDMYTKMTATTGSGKKGKKK
ncbi:lactate dehydrogenase [Comamonas testosteroni]|nr:lactate dehydrogenase [Comamonas testosteroni]